MSKCISVHGEYSEHEYTTKPICDYCGQISEMIALAQLQVMKSALEQIQELHKPRFIGTESDGTPMYACMHCIREKGTCKTRKLADAGLAVGGEERG